MTSFLLSFYLFSLAVSGFKCQFSLKYLCATSRDFFYFYFECNLLRLIDCGMYWQLAHANMRDACCHARSLSVCRSPSVNSELCLTAGCRAIKTTQVKLMVLWLAWKISTPALSL